MNNTFEVVLVDLPVMNELTVIVTAPDAEQAGDAARNQVARMAGHKDMNKYKIIAIVHRMTDLKVWSTRPRVQVDDTHVFITAKPVGEDYHVRVKQDLRKIGDDYEYECHTIDKVIPINMFVKQHGRLKEYLRLLAEDLSRVRCGVQF